MKKVEELVKRLREGQIGRREFLKAAATYGAAGATLGLTSASTEAADDILVGFSFPSFEHFRWAHDRRYFQTRADELGMKYIIQGAEEDVATQDSQVDAMLTRGIQALVLIPVNIESAINLADRVKREADIPIVSYNSVIPTASIDFWAARDNYFVGEVQARQALKDAKFGNWAIVSGPAGVDVARQKTEGALRILQPRIDSGEIKIVSHEWHEAWRSETALNQIENALTLTDNDLQAVVANEDGLALGSLRALTEQGLAGKVWLCGEDVFPEVAQEIVKGNMAMSAWTDLIQMGRSAADAAFALANGEIPPSNDVITIEGKEVPGMRIESRGVTKEALPEFLRLTDWLKPEDVGLE
jgi:D-xylose transport system substrate-binding protein